MIRKSSFSRIDEQVFFTMGVILLLSLIILGFRFAVRKECKPVNLIIADDGPYFTDNLIRFKAAGGAHSYHWDFGDGTPIVIGTNIATHLYKKHMKYTVTLSVDESCFETVDIHISEAPPVISVAPSTEISFAGPSQVYVDRQVEFTDTVSGHTSWRWYIQGQEGVQGFEKVFKCHFPQDGVIDVWVVANDDSKNVIRRHIIVARDEVKEEQETTARVRRQLSKDPRIVPAKNNPTEPPIQQPDNPTKKDEVKKEEPVVAPKTVYPEITGKQIGEMIVAYKEGKINAGDFDKYFCGKVSVTYKDKFSFFPQFLEDVKGSKGKITDISVQLSQDASNCIKSMTVIIKRKKFLGVF